MPDAVALKRAMLRRIRSTPESRVRRLLKFATRDFAKLSPDAQRTAWDMLFALQSQQPVRVPVHADTLRKTHQELAGCIQALADGQPYNLLVPDLMWRLRPPPRRPAGDLVRLLIQGKLRDGRLP